MKGSVDAGTVQVRALPVQVNDHAGTRLRISLKGVKDIEDLKTLYRLAWDGSLTEINGTPVALQRPFSEVSGLGRPFGAAAAKRGGSCRCCG